ncbi:MAG TPA: M28 family metallopeptidase [Candidatus Acidoferrales bacterium]
MTIRRKTLCYLTALSVCLSVCGVCLDVYGNPQAAEQISGFVASRVAAEIVLEQNFEKIPDPTQAEADLRHLTSQPHVAGTEGSHRTAEWLRDQFRSYGFDTEIVTYNAYLPLPRAVQLEMIEPEKISLATPEPPLDQESNRDDSQLFPAVNDYSPSGDVTAPVIYVNYGAPEDYRMLDALGISVKGKLVLARYGRDYRGVKAKLAEDRGAAGIILYSDPADDGFTSGGVFPDGPWRPIEGVQRGSILYTQIRPGDPLVTDNPEGKRLPTAEAPSLPHIPAMPISAKDASVILSHLGSGRVPQGWQGGLALAYHVGPGDVKLHLKVSMAYAQRPIYDVVARLHGTSDDEWVILGNHHDAWVYGAADPGSGTAGILEMARSLGELVRSGWTPRRTIVICEWDAEEPGLIGSTDWVEANRAELQAKAVAYINTDVGVTGSSFSGAAVPSLKQFLRDATKDVPDPQSGKSVYAAWTERAGLASDELFVSSPGGSHQRRPAISALGAGSDFSPFLDYAGIPSMDVSFTGDYGVYHSRYDDFYWMQHFGDPDFSYEAVLARVLGVLALRFDEADIVSFDYGAYASEIAQANDELFSRAAAQPGASAILKPVSDAAGAFSEAATQAQDALSTFSGDPEKASAINRDLIDVEQAFLAPQGLSGRPWFKHTIFAPGSNAGYAAEILPGVTEALQRHDLAALQRETDSLSAALRRAAARLNDAIALARSASASPEEGH